MVDQSETRIRFRKLMRVKNYAGTWFRVLVHRTVRAMTRANVERVLKVDLPEGVGLAGFASENRITNVGQQPWTREGGLLSIWILGQFKPSPQTTVVIPFNQSQESRADQVVTDAYFGEIASDRLRVDQGAGVVYFKADGQSRSKIGLGPAHAKPIFGSYDATRRVLTLVHYTRPTGDKPYVNSLWRHQDQPYRGDVVNSYNDGPPEPGAKPLGPFYELESSSPAAALAPGASQRHVHRTIHLVGPAESLDRVARQTLGVGLKAITTAFEQ